MWYWYLIWFVAVTVFLIYWNQGLGRLAPKPQVEKMPYLMVNIFFGIVIVMTILQAFGIGRGHGFPLPK
jgi:hypothetical protein